MNPCSGGKFFEAVQAMSSSNLIPNQRFDVMTFKHMRAKLIEGGKPSTTNSTLDIAYFGWLRNSRDVKTRSIVAMSNHCSRCCTSTAEALVWSISFTTSCAGLWKVASGVMIPLAVWVCGASAKHFALPTKHLPPDGTTAQWALRGPSSRTCFQILIVGLGATVWRWW